MSKNYVLETITISAIVLLVCSFFFKDLHPVKAAWLFVGCSTWLSLFIMANCD